MSFAQKTESPALTPTTPDRRNTYREAEAVPFGNGYFRVAPKWITDRFNDHWSNGKTTGQAYCSVAGVLCHGPIQHVRAIYAGGDLVAVLDVSRPTNPLDPDYYFTTIEFGGTDADLGVSNRVRFYWGDESQPVDSWLTTTTGQDHPPYKGQTLVVFERLHCGQIQANSQARPALPNIEFTVYRLPSPSMPSGLRIPASLPGGVAQFRGVNLISALWDFLTHPRGGLGLTSSILDQSDWTAKAEALEDGTKPASGLYGEEAYLSPLLTGQQDADKIIQDALQYIDGWVYTEAGKIRIDYFPNDGTLPGSLPEITEADHVEPPSIQTASLSESPTTIVVELLEGDSGELDLIDAVESASVPFVREITGNSVVKTLQRPWITSRDIGAKYAARAAGLATIPAKTGESVVRLDRAVRLDGTPLRIGDIFTLNYAPMSELVTARLIERLEDETTATLRWERERGTSSVPYAPPTDARDNYVLPNPPTPGTGDWTAVEAPSGISADAAVIVLAQRPSDALAGLRVYLDADNDWSAGSTLLGLQGFAAKVTLDTTINSSVTSCILDGTGVDVSPFLGSGATATEQADDTLLLLMGSEWMSIGAVTSAGAGSYNVAITRGRVGSPAAGHTAADVGWVIRRDRIALWRNAIFEQTESRYFKILFYHAKADGALSTAKTVTFADRSPGVVTTLTATALPEGVRLDWVEPADTDVLVYEIFEDPTTTQPDDPIHFCPAPANSYVRLGATAGDSLKFWVRTRDEAGNVSASVGPVTVTVEASSSPTLWPRGTFSAAAFYLDNDDVKNLVRHSGSVYKANNTSKSGLDTWDVPGTSSDWVLFAVEDLITATGLILAEVGYLYDTLYVGDGSANKGRIMSHGVTGYGTGASGFFLGFDGVTPKMFVGNPSGDQIKWSGSALTVTGTLSVGSGDSATLINSSSINFGTRFQIVDLSGQTTLVFQKTSGQSTGNKGFHIQADASNTVLRGGDVSVVGPFNPTWSITSTTGVGMFTKVQIGADCEFERISANTIKTVDTLWPAGTLLVGANSISLTSPTSGELLVGAAVKASGIAVDNSGTFEFLAAAGNAAVYVRNQNFEVRDAGGTYKFQVDKTTGGTVIRGALQVDLAGNFTGALSTASSLSVTAQGTIGGNLTVGSAASAVVNFHTDVNLYRSAADVLKTDDAFHALGLGAFNAIAAYNGSPSDYVFLTGSAVGATIVKGVPFRVATSGGVLKLEIDPATGNISIGGNKVLSTRYGSTPGDVAGLVALCQHMGFCP